MSHQVINYFVTTSNLIFCHNKQSTVLSQQAINYFVTTSNQLILSQQAIRYFITTNNQLFCYNKQSTIFISTSNEPFLSHQAINNFVTKQQFCPIGHQPLCHKKQKCRRKQSNILSQKTKMLSQKAIKLFVTKNNQPFCHITFGIPSATHLFIKIILSIRSATHAAKGFSDG